MTWDTVFYDQVDVHQITEADILNDVYRIKNFAIDYVKNYIIIRITNLKQTIENKRS